MFTNLRAFFAPTTRTAARRNRTTLRLETLERRETPAAFTVNTLVDSVDASPGDGIARDANGLTSLRAAIEESNALGGAHTIGFTPQVVGVIDLTLGSSLDLDADITIHGFGQGVSRPGGLGFFRIMSVAQGRTCEIQFLTLTNGNSAFSAGGIDNSGNLTLYHVGIKNNQTAVDGGAIRNRNGGIIWMQSCEIRDNSALGNGGGIRNDGDLFVGDSTIMSNRAVNGNGGGIFNTQGANVIIADPALLAGPSQISGNSASGLVGAGGGVWNAGAFTMNFGGLSGNGAGAGGGGIYSMDGTATLNSVGLVGNGATTGGGFYLASGSLTTNQCGFVMNFATTGNGGAYKVGSTYTDNGSTFFMNWVTMI